MGINSNKIRRRVMIHGEQTWISANSEQEYADKLLRLTSGPQHQTSHKFQDYAERWFILFARPNIEEVTAVTYRRQLDLHINPIIGSMPIEEIEPYHIQEVFNALGEHASQQTKAKVKNVLNQIFKMAVENRIIQWNPMQSTSLRIKGASAIETQPYAVADMRYFVEHLDDIENAEDRAWLAFSTCLPLRPEEVLGLRWGDIDEEARIVHVRNTVTHPTRNAPVYKAYTKTDASRRDLSVPQWLIDRLPERKHDADFVIGGSTPVSYTKLRCMRKRIANQIGYDGTITPRRFRTTVATDISNITHDLKLVQRMLGHSTPQMTLKHYDKGRNTAVDATFAIEQCYGLTK